MFDTPIKCGQKLWYPSKNSSTPVPSFKNDSSLKDENSMNYATKNDTTELSTGYYQSLFHIRYQILFHLTSKTSFPLETFQIFHPNDDPTSNVRQNLVVYPVVLAYYCVSLCFWPRSIRRFSLLLLSSLWCCLVALDRYSRTQVLL